MNLRLIQADVLDGLRQMADASVHCVVTSPPYWGLRDYGVSGQIGLESTPDEYVAKMVAVFREVRRVLRDDGTCWVNLGDSYAHSGACGGGSPDGPRQARQTDAAKQKAMKYDVPPGLKSKDLCGIPWRVAFALQADGWWLRQDIIWHKPNPMPESVTDRCTKAHEYLFLLTKSARYYYDAAAIADKAIYAGTQQSFATPYKSLARNLGRGASGNEAPGAPLVVMGNTRNRRSVWTIPTQPFPEAHFATFPPALVEPCILAGTSAHGCCAACGAPTFRDMGWQTRCDCHADLMPATVLDPFFGAGTTGLVALRAGRSAVGIELNPEYAAMAERRIRGELGLLLKG